MYLFILYCLCKCAVDLLQFTPFHFNPLQFSPIHSMSLKFTPNHSNSVHFTPIQSNSLKFTQIHSNPLQSTPLQSISLQSTPNRSISFQFTHTNISMQVNWVRKQFLTLVYIHTINWDTKWYFDIYKYHVTYKTERVE